MAHLALYRTYRPQDFDAVIGQKHIVQTVKNQIKHDLLAHAYMFSGPRGTGKTSIARIVAKAINCASSVNGNPCNECESCVSVNNSNHPDVIELDGASNNGVDEIRDIRDRVKYSPSLSAYKVYIIDEVHMLSTGAFNALLKTLEEPPAHVVFMLATTEIHKVPDTILSRVQRFDLKQIPTLDMAEHLGKILIEKEIKFEESVPELVAQLAAGGLRDGLSILDQAIAYKDEIITIADIHELNGSVDEESTLKMLKQIMQKDFTGLVETGQLLLKSGKLPMRIIDGLFKILRDILKAQKLNEPDNTALAGAMPTKMILDLIKKLNAIAQELKISTDSELMLEIGLIELAMLDENEDFVVTAPVATVLSSGEDLRVNDLVKQLEVLKIEVAKLQQQLSNKEQVLTREVRSEQPSVDFPVFVQGELVNGDPSDIYDPVMADMVSSREEFETPDDALSLNVVAEKLLIEDVLNEATMNDKMSVQDKIKALNPFAKLDLKDVVMLLKDCEIAAASSRGCVLVFDYATTADKMYSDDFRANALFILSELTGGVYDFIALPKEFWVDARQSYVEQKKRNEVPQLVQYSSSRVLDVKDGVGEDAVVPFYQDIVEMFGDLVEVID